MNINQINSIFLRRSMKLIVPTEKTVVASTYSLPNTYIAAILKNLESYGYTLSSSLITAIKGLTVDTVYSFYASLVGELKKITGANKTWTPMYPNFPAQVMSATDAELYINAIMHYLGDVVGCRVMPVYEAKERFPLMDNFNLKVIDVGTHNDFRTLIRNLMGAKTSISQHDKEDISTVIKLFGDNASVLLPMTVTHKENLAFIASELVKHTKLTDEITRLFNSVTDVLRLAVAMSDGDVSLATNTKFRKFSRPERKRFMQLINRMSNVKEDMLRNRNRWIRLSERIHPTEDTYSPFTVAIEAFSALRNNEKIETFGGVVESALLSKDMKAVINQLKRRPGELARRLDHLLRIASTRSEQNLIISAFVSIAEKVSTPVLLQVMGHFNHRNTSDLRVIFPKGNVAKAMALTNDLPVIAESICGQIVSVCENTMRTRFTSLEPMGKVYIDESMKGMIIPFSQRSASRAMRTIVRGSRIKLSEGKNVVRFFLWWRDIINTDGGGRVDVDLSAMMYNEKWVHVDQVSYTQLRSNNTGVIACHSGDITSAPKGACEFIDIDIESVKRNKGRYIVMNVISFTGQKFSDMPECFAGWMLRNEAQSGEIFDARTVENKIDLTAESKYSIPLVIDTYTREVIWGDLALNTDPRNEGRYSRARNVENNSGSITLMGKSISSIKKTNIHELMTLHASARGTIVDNKDDADIVVSMDGNITPFDVEKIMSEFL